MQLDVQFMIYIYMAICFSLLVFNLLYIEVDSFRSRRKEKPGRSLRKLRKRIQRYCVTDEIPEKWHRDNRKSLSRVGRLERFQWSMEKIMEEMPEEASAYLADCEGDFRYLASVYLGKDNIEQAYFARILELYSMCRGREYNEMKRILVEMACSNSIYTRENALRVLYQSGSEVAVRQAFLNMSRSGVFHYGKLITDGLLSFQGDQALLAEELWNCRAELSDDYTLAIMQFIRMSQEGYGEEFLRILEDTGQNQELRLEAIRYFRKYRYRSAYPALLKIMNSREIMGWEYLAVAALALENYPGDRTVEVLKTALNSPEWHVRYNAADTLIRALKVDYSRLKDVLEGPDRYAKEILLYMMQRYGQEENGK